MAKSGVMIDFIGKGPGDEEEDESPPFDDGDEDPEDRAPVDPQAALDAIETQIALLRRAV